MTTLICILIAAGFVIAAMQFDRSQATRRLQQGGTVAVTDRGPVEYAAAGSGIPVVVLHGGLGGWDQGLALGVSLLAPTEHAEPLDYHQALRESDHFLRNRFHVIAPSRVGYLHTPLRTGSSPSDCADALAALLEQLDVKQVTVVGVSGGGPTALQFAIRHPHQILSLVMVAAIAKRHLQPSRTTESLAGKVVFSRGFGFVLDFFYRAAQVFAAILPVSFTRLILAATETFDRPGIERRLAMIRRNPRQFLWLRGLLASGYPLSARKVGLTNDLKQFAAIDTYPVNNIECPTLVVHARHDGNVTFDHAEFVATGVPGAQLLVAETCGHLLWMSEEEPKIRAAIVDFIQRHWATTD